jgi:hypothetical protein
MKVVIIILCVLLGLIGLLMSACGGFFTIASLLDSNTGLIAISLPFLLLGAAFIWGAIAGIRRAMRKTSGTPEQWRADT